jgi:hypothetical protein
LRGLVPTLELSARNCCYRCFHDIGLVLRSPVTVQLKVSYSHSLCGQCVLSDFQWLTGRVWQRPKCELILGSGLRRVGRRHTVIAPFARSNRTAKDFSQNKWAATLPDGHPFMELFLRLQVRRFLSTMQRYFGNARARVRSRPNWASSRESTSVDTRPRVTRVNS